MKGNKNQCDKYERTTISNRLIVLVSILNLFFLMFTSSLAFNEFIASICARGLIISNLTFLILFMIRNSRHAKSNYLLFLALLFSLLISYILSSLGSWMDFFITMCSYLSVPIYMLVIPSVKFSNKTFSWFKKIGIFYALFFIMSFLYKPTILPFSGALTLGYSNSNTAGMYMYLVAIFILLAFQSCSHRNEKKISYILVAIIDYLIVRTQCRTAFLLTSLCLICAIFPNLFHPKKKLAVACVVSPMVFFYLYSFLYKISWNLDFTILGRTIYSGRQAMFASQGMQFSLFGNYSHHFGGLNIALVFITSVGVLGFSLFTIYSILFMLSPFVQKRQVLTPNQCNLNLLCIGTIFIYGCVESALFTGGSVFAGLIGCAMATINTREEETCHCSKKL